MSKAQQVRFYDYVNHPYGDVRDALVGDPLAVFRQATTAATTRATSVAAELHVEVGGVRVATDIAIDVRGVEHRPRQVGSPEETVLTIEWKAVKSPQLFPVMNGELHVYALTATETQLDFIGAYTPPGGALGGVFDSLVGHRVADAAVDRFVRSVAQHLRETLAG